jgi:hypothetical protein
LQHRFTKLQAIGDGQRLHHIEHRMVDIAIAALADAPDQVRGVLGLREEFRGGTGGAFGRQGKYR